MLTRTTIEFESETQQQLERLAETRQQSSASLLREAVEQFIDRETRQAAFVADSLVALNSYDATGLHLTHDEIKAWLLKQEHGDDTLLPECHV